MKIFICEHCAWDKRVKHARRVSQWSEARCEVCETTTAGDRYEAEVEIHPANWERDEDTDED